MTLRWDPIYDAESLNREIVRLAAAVQNGAYKFYQLVELTPPFCQGDIVELNVDVPCIDEDGVAIGLTAPSPYWMLLGNSCDHHRELSKAPWTQAVPLEPRGNVSAAVLKDYSEYKHSRQFCVPAWPSVGADVSTTRRLRWSRDDDAEAAVEQDERDGAADGSVPCRRSADR